MICLIILLLALDLRAYGSKDPGLFTLTVILPDSNKCSNVKKPLCGTNGKEFMYFENKCYMDVKNYEMLTRGFREYVECPLSLCQFFCPTCAPINDPVCAVEEVTGQKKLFPNMCEVDRIICTNKEVWSAVKRDECDAKSEQNLNQLKDSECPEYCTPEHRPICARFMTLVKEFFNECELKAIICQTRQKWHIIKHGPCQLSTSNNGAKFFAEESKCSKICPLEHKPVCAKLHNEFREFQNKCELENIICQFGHDWQIIKEGYCFEGSRNRKPAECPEYCESDYQPLCTEFKGERKEFRNLCEFTRALCKSDEEWEIVNWGPCSTNPEDLKQSESKCPVHCIKKYEPVCAKLHSKFKEFRNQCELQKTICQTNADWKLIKKGSCPLEPASKTACHSLYTKEFNPVCASFNGKLREFFNICEMEKNACETNTGWELLKMDSCRTVSLNTLTDLAKCPKFCSKEWKPVCAEFQSKLRQFANKCEMQKTICETKKNWKFFKRGYCPLITEAKASCPILCTTEFSPVCARYNGQFREFFNNCELEKINCETKTNWELLNRGPCFLNQFKRLAQNACDKELPDPICANDGHNTKTFDNACQLAQETELTGISWSILYKGTCGNTSPTTNSYDGSSVAKTDEATTMSSYKATARSATIAAPTLKKTYSSNYNNAQENDNFEQYNKDKEVEKVSKDDRSNDISSLDSSSSALKYENMSGNETNHSWTEKQLNTSQTVENDLYFYLSNDSHMKRASVKEKNYTFNYEGYSKEDDDSAEIYSREMNAIGKSYNDSLATILSKGGGNYSVMNDTSETAMENMMKKNDVDDENDLKLMPKSNEISQKATEPYEIKHSTGSNSTSSMKGEIYNGVVYKAPVYDAPTYNFIYTAPISFPDFRSHYTNPVSNYSNTLSNQSIPSANTSIPFHPFDFLSSLAAITKSWTKSNLMSPTNATTSNKNYLVSNQNQHFVMPIDNKNQRQRIPLSQAQRQPVPLLQPETLSALPSIPQQAPPQSSAQQYIFPSLKQRFKIPSAPGQLNDANSQQNSLNSTLL